MMGKNDGGEGDASVECCMCGDYGLSSHLFKCTNCGFRSQHKYCSSLYPEAESYHICNWCLEDKKRVERNNIITTKISPNYSSPSDSCHRDQKRAKETSRDNKMIKIKPEQEGRADPDWPGSSAGRNKRVTTDHSGGFGTKRIMVKKRVVRNKVRRYKLLDEVP